MGTTIYLVWDFDIDLSAAVLCAIRCTLSIGTRIQRCAPVSSFRFSSPFVLVLHFGQIH